MIPTLVAFALIIVFCLLVIKFLYNQPKSNHELKTLGDQLESLRKELQDTQGRQRMEMQQRLDSISGQLNKNISESASVLQKHFQHTHSINREITEKLTKLDETNKQVLGFSEQLQSLENILRNPKQRGILGEYWLETLLGQVLQPGQYQMQHELGLDETTNTKLIPDAVLFIKEMLIPIDAKFSLENYNRISQETDQIRREQLEKDFKVDVKKRIDETSKYIRPELGTTNFAFMFVPAEGVYHNLISASVGAVQVNTQNLIEYAFKKNVVIVSPTSFFAYLQTVILGLRALQIEESVKVIQIQAEHLMNHLRAYEDYHNKLGKHLETTYRVYADSSRELKKIDKDIYKISNGSAGNQLVPAEIDRPSMEA